MRSRLDSYATEPIGASEANRESKASSTPKRPRRTLRPTSIKLSLETRRQIFAEVSRRKGLELPNRTIQGVIEDAVAQLVAKGE
jgi:hypothetical protein